MTHLTGPNTSLKVAEPTATLDPNRQAFRWSDCSDEDIHTRVEVKQRAVNDALRHALDISRQLCAPSSDAEHDSASPEERCGKELIEWMGEIGL